MNCKCIDKRGIKLAVCIAPPPGDYDLEINVSKSYSLVINSEGVFLKQTVIDESLPFARTIVRRVDEDFLDRIVLKVDRRKIPCLAARALIKAAENGSVEARKKLEECRKLVDELAEEC